MSATTEKNKVDKSWYFTEKELTQSASRAHDLSVEEINKLRSDGASFVQNVGRHMKMPQFTIATAIVFLQRFYLYQSFKDFPIPDMGACCLFLAGKVEDSPKKLRDIILKSHAYQNKDLRETDDVFFKKKEVLLRNERILLQTISFDLTVEHPYSFLLNYMKKVKGDGATLVKRDKELAQAAWNYVNDSLRTTLCLQYTPQVVSCAVIDLAAQRLSYELPKTSAEGKEWFHSFVDKDITVPVIKEIGKKILDLYEKDLQMQREKQKHKERALQREKERQRHSGLGVNNNGGSSSSSNSVIGGSERRPPPPGATKPRPPRPGEKGSHHHRPGGEKHAPRPAEAPGAERPQKRAAEEPGQPPVKHAKQQAQP